MSADSLLLDSNIIVHVLQGHRSLAEQLEGKHLLVSSITRIELYSWPGSSKERDTWLDAFFAECEVVELDRSVQDRTIGLRKKFKLTLADAIIAATALHKDVPLLTADQDFKKVGPAVRVILVET